MDVGRKSVGTSSEVPKLRSNTLGNMSIRVSIRANSSLMRMIHKKKIGSLHIGSLMYVYPNKNPHRLVPAMLSCQGSGKNSATARASPGERATPSATPLFSPELLGASPEVKSQLAQADQAHRMEDLEGWKMLEHVGTKCENRRLRAHTQTPTRTQTQTQKHAHTRTLYFYVYIYVYIYTYI